MTTPAAIQYETVTAAAKRLCVHPMTLQRAVARGDLTGYRVGGKLLRLNRAEVDAWLTPVPARRRA